jgi:hypothetical protein
MPDDDPPEKVTTSEFPWTVLIIKREKENTVSYCAGSLINSMYGVNISEGENNQNPSSNEQRPD